jgi:L-lactate dehydrogenase complex protein LldF
MEPTSHAFKANAHRALGDANLQRAMTMMRTGFPEKRAQAIARLPEFDALRDEGIAIKNHVIAHLDFYLERFE